MFKKLMFFILPLMVFAAPKNPTVIRGEATFSNQGNNTTIHASHNSVINYQGFDVAKHEMVQFIQPDSKSRVLNRINSTMPSQIDGALKANGIVYLVNPSGIMFGKDSVIDVGGLLAAAAHISDNDFINGIDRFKTPNGEVFNDGKILAESFVHLIGKRVTNLGQIIANEDVCAFTSDKEIFFGQADGHSFLVLQKNEQKDTVILEDDIIGSGDIYSLAIENLGSIESKTITLQTSKGQINASGSLKAKDEDKGGEIAILGDVVTINHANIDVSANNGGGEVYIGGEYKGEGDLPTAQYTYVDPKSIIQANAILEGDGGKVIVWSDNITYFDGKIAAVGGEVSGNGGFVETSGKKKLSIEEGRVHAHAINGKDGTWLLDPEDVIITDIVPAPPADDTINAPPLPYELQNPGYLSPETVVVRTAAIRNSTGAIEIWSGLDMFIYSNLDLTNPAGPSSVSFNLWLYISPGPRQYIYIDIKDKNPPLPPPPKIITSNVPLSFAGTVQFQSDTTFNCTDVTFNHEPKIISWIEGTGNPKVTFNITSPPLGSSTVRFNVDAKSSVAGWFFNDANPGVGVSAVNCGNISTKVIETDCAFTSSGTINVENFDALSANTYNVSFNRLNVTDILSTLNTGSLTCHGVATLPNAATFQNNGAVYFLGASSSFSNLIVTNTVTDFTVYNPTVALATNFSNTGILQLNNAVNQTASFDGGITVSGPSQVNLYGELNTVAQPIDIQSPMVLQSDAKITTKVYGGPDNTIDFAAIDGTYDLNINSGSSATTFNGSVGSTNKLHDLLITASPQLTFSQPVHASSIYSYTCPVVFNMGAMIEENLTVGTPPDTYYSVTFNDWVSIGSPAVDAHLIARSITTSGAADYNFQCNILCKGGGQFDHFGTLMLGALGRNQSCEFDADVNVTQATTTLNANLILYNSSSANFTNVVTVPAGNSSVRIYASQNGGIAFGNALNALSPLALDTANGAITFANTVNATRLNITSHPNISFPASVNATNLFVSGTTDLTFNGPVVITRELSGLDPNHFTFNNQTTISGSVSGGNILTQNAFNDVFGGDINGKGSGTFKNAGTLQLGTSGNKAEFRGNLLIDNTVTALTFNLRLLKANGSVNIHPALNLTRDCTIQGNGIHFYSTIDEAFCLTVDGGSSPVTFDDAIGGVTPVGCLIATGNPITFNTGSITASGGTLDFTGPVKLNIDPTTFTDTGSTGIIFRDTVDGNVVLNLDAVANITMQGNVGATPPPSPPRLKDINVVKCNNFAANATVICDAFTTTICNSSYINSLITQGRTDQDGGDINITSNGSILFGTVVNATGGSLSAPGIGKDGGDITLTSNGSSGTNPTIEIGSADVSGGPASGANAGGNAGNINILPNPGFRADSKLGDFPIVRIGLYGTISAKGGSGAPIGSDGDVNLNAAGRSKSLSVATIYSHKFKGADISIYGKDIIMGKNEALTVFGDLNLHATGRIEACDIVSVNDMLLTAPTIQIYKHMPGIIIDSKGNKITNPETHFLAGGNVTTSGILNMVGPGADPIILSLNLAGRMRNSFSDHLFYDDIPLNFHVSQLNSFSYYSNEAIEIAKEPQVDWDLLDEPYETEEDEENEDENNETL